ncbi:MAG: hypothetical protein Q9227_000103 [Pyrenula ochraceoflavens]
MSSRTFSYAQARVLERRQLHEQQAAAASADHASCSGPGLRGSLQQSSLSLWRILVSRTGTSPVHRVGQVDAELLDEELLSLLKSQVGDALKYYSPNLQVEWSDEIMLILRAVIFKLSIWDHNASYGASLQNLVYADARSSATGKAAAPKRWQKGAYGLITVAGRYCWAKWQDWLLDQESDYNQTPTPRTELLSRLTDWASTTHGIASFFSFCIFLVNGRYRTLTDRLLRLRLVTPDSQVRREVSFEYLNRQLVWHAFTEFLLFVLPLVGISRWRRWLSRAWRKAKTVFRTNASDSEAYEPEKNGPFASLPERTCAICYSDSNPSSTSEAEVLGVNAAAGGIIGSAQTDIVNPYETAPCGCIYCFTCIATKIEAEEGEGWMCLRCGELAMSCRPWRGDVLVENYPKPTSKSVGFVDSVVDDSEAFKGHENANGVLKAMKQSTSGDQKESTEINDNTYNT